MLLLKQITGMSILECILKCMLSQKLCFENNYLFKKENNVIYIKLELQQQT